MSNKCLSRFNKRDFDELMNIHNNISGMRSVTSPVCMLKCCLVLPCPAEEVEIFRVGKNLHSLLNIPGSLYYRTLNPSIQSDDTTLLNEDGKMTEESFRRHTSHRIKRDEVCKKFA